VAADLEGYAELTKKLSELADPKQGLSALREAVRKPMRQVMQVAQSNIAKISPGRADIHRTYKGRLVGAGFAARSLRMVVKVGKDKRAVSALLGVRKEAFYAVQFFELGTAAIPKQPWLVPALESSKDEAIRSVGATLKARIEKIAKKRAAAGRK
jgi:HK97 gp10 family phage protein